MGRRRKRPRCVGELLWPELAWAPLRRLRQRHKQRHIPLACRRKRPRCVGKFLRAEVAHAPLRHPHMLTRAEPFWLWLFAPYAALSPPSARRTRFLRHVRNPPLQCLRHRSLPSCGNPDRSLRWRAVRILFATAFVVASRFVRGRAPCPTNLVESCPPPRPLGLACPRTTARRCQPAVPQRLGCRRGPGQVPHRSCPPPR